jgi:SAM-dependent methyltransferase
MHPEQQNYISKISTEFSEFFSNKKVLDVGSLNINGCIKDYTNNCDYTGIDVGPGNNVDVVCPGQDFNDPDESYDMVCSSECFEHNPFWVETFRNMIRLCKSKGFVFFTCATTGREEHGTKEAHSWCSPLTIELGWNYYKNLEEKDFREHFDFDKIFEKYQFEVNTSGSPDLYFWGIKKDIKNLKFSDVFDLHQGNSADKWEGYLKIYDEELSLVKNNCK